MYSKFSPDIQKQVDRGITVLERGGLVAFPTDTIYGLGAGAYIESAVEKVYQVKKRPRDMALPLLLADVSQLNEVARYVPPVAWLLARHFLPGGLTLVLYKSSLVPDIVTAGSDTVAVRVPAHPVPIALIHGIGMPLVGTSANLSGKPNPLTANDVCAQLGNRLDLIIDGGPSPGGKESTIVDVTGEKPVILREGAISAEKLREVVDV
ncbi:MAG: L-threonylcarbamoyladenylate synthase [Dehalococcoidia bacterium]|nr:L-threonylcarbamoyladenylate synthase [Dehalococcoidia bacterium]